jgi:hypothetical protein
MASATFRASVISIPATNRELSRVPSLELSQKLRKDRLRESAMRAERNMDITRLCRYAPRAGNFRPHQFRTMCLGALRYE